MVFTKQQNDLFRHWILGLGSGDLEMQTMGGDRDQAGGVPGANAKKT